MRKICLSIFLFLLLLRTAHSQKIEGYKYHAAYIPSNCSINIDGDLNEWKWVPDEYKIRTKDLVNSEQVKPEDLEVELFVAWSKINNKLYIVCESIDDILNSDELNHDDGIEINLNPNKVFGNYYNTIYKFMFFNIFYVAIAPYSTYNNIYIYYGPEWIRRNREQFNYKVKTEKLKDGRMCINYEIELRVSSDLSLYSGTLSSNYILENDQVIGLTILINDVDYNNYERDVQLRTFSGNALWHRAEEASLFILDPPRKCSNIYDELFLLSDN